MTWSPGRWRRRDSGPRAMGARRPADAKQCTGAVRAAAARVYHCAGCAACRGRGAQRAEPLAANVLATHHLLDALRRAGERCRVLVTGIGRRLCAVAARRSRDDRRSRRQPLRRSASSHRSSSPCARSRGRLDVIVTRSFNHTGPRQTPPSSAPSVARQIALIERGALEPVIQVGNLDAEPRPHSTSATSCAPTRR